MCVRGIDDNGLDLSPGYAGDGPRGLRLSLDHGRGDIGAE
jgi:hypothetical protein